MSEEGEQPVLFDLAPPAPPPTEAAYCPICGTRAGVVRYGIFDCAQGHQREQIRAAERVAEMNATRRRRHGKGTR